MRQRTRTKRSLRTKLSSAILIIVLLTIAIISFLSNYFLNRQFTSYIARQQDIKAQVITSSISQQYSMETGQWNMNYIYAIGMNSLYEGYIIRVYDSNHNVLWDALSHDMELCYQIMDDISHRMELEYPQLHGEFQATDYPLSQNGQTIGGVSISQFGPFFMNENDFIFLRSMNTILISVGLISLAVSVIVGHLLAKRISKPILKTVEMTKQIEEGRYEVRLQEDTDTLELDRLMGSINHLAASLQRLEKLRKQLTEDVAHELRTPITVLQSYIEAMAEGLWEVTPERLESCYEEALRIGKLVGDLEKLSKIESESLKLNKSNFSLHHVLDKTVRSMEKELQEKQLEVEITGPRVMLYADEERMKQVAVNLINNAIKYSKDGSRITIQTFEEQVKVGFSVIDKGIGISGEELPFIFERFYRADKSRNRASGGSGIGLTIVKAIVEAHGGVVMVQSEPMEGSIFTVTLPRG